MAHFVYGCEAIDPYSGSEIKTRTVGLEKSQVDALNHSEHTVRLTRLRLAKEVLEFPVVIFEDLKRPEQEDGLCYCGKPPRDYRGVGKETPAPPGMVFCVFVTRSGKISAWRWEPSDKLSPDFPEDWKNRFGRPIWPPDQAN